MATNYFATSREEKIQDAQRKLVTLLDEKERLQKELKEANTIYKEAEQESNVAMAKLLQAEDDARFANTKLEAAYEDLDAVKVELDCTETQIVETKKKLEGLRTVQE